MENIQENQPFTSKDVISVFASLALLLLVAVNSFSHAFADYKGNGAQREMAKLSLQLMSHSEDFQPGKAIDPSAELRGPASTEPQGVIDSLGLEGKIGKDPWGEPYQYRIFEKASKVYAVVIWSNGPNSTQELSEKSFLRTKSGRVFRVLRAGDDLSHIEIAN